MLLETINVLIELLGRQYELIDLLLDCDPPLSAEQAKEIREIQNFDRKTTAIIKQNVKTYLHDEGKLTLLPVEEKN